MAQNSESRQQSDAIRARMKLIRSELPQDVILARQRVREWANWRYHFRKHSIAFLGAAAVVGYLLVPGNRGRRETIIRSEVRDKVQASESAKGGLAGSLFGALLTMALRSGATMLTQRLSHSILQYRPHSGVRTNEVTRTGVAPVPSNSNGAYRA